MTAYVEDVDGTSFPADMPQSLRRCLFGLLRLRSTPDPPRVKISYRGGFEEFGYLSRTAGDLKVPMIRPNRNSSGGDLVSGGVLTVESSRADRKGRRTVYWSLERDDPVAWVMTE